MPLSLGEAIFFINTYFQIYLNRDYFSYSEDYLPPCLQSSLSYYSHFRPTQALPPQNSYNIERNYDWSEQLMKDPQDPPTPQLNLVCHDSQLAPIVNMDGRVEITGVPCHCVHCFIHDAYFLHSIRRCLYVFTPSTTSNLPPFVLSSSEFQALQNGSLHLRLFNVLFEENKWQLSPSRYRFHLNSIDIFSLQVSHSPILSLSLESLDRELLRPQFVCSQRNQLYSDFTLCRAHFSHCFISLRRPSDRFVPSKSAGKEQRFARRRTSELCSALAADRRRRRPRVRFNGLRV